jgi:hypothetical protein
MSWRQISTLPRRAARAVANSCAKHRMSHLHQRSVRFRLVLSGLLAAGFAACSSTPPLVYQQEHFGITSAHSRAYPASPSTTCEAARRALLSQGYLISSAKSDMVEGRKSFQNDANTHIEIGFHVVCVSTSKGGGSIAFVNALHDRYALKKSATSASVGVGAVGTLSVPFGSSDDAMVKVASETITARDFYDRFFGLLAYYLASEADSAPLENKSLDQAPESTREPTHEPPRLTDRPPTGG